MVNQVTPAAGRERGPAPCESRPWIGPDARLHLRWAFLQVESTDHAFVVAGEFGKRPLDTCSYLYGGDACIHMLMWSDQVDFNNISRERWELKDSAKNKARQPLTNHFDGTWTASYDLSGLPSSATDWTWKGEVKDNAGIRYRPSDFLTVLP